MRHTIRTIRRRSRSRTIDKHPQRAVLTRARHLNLDHFQPARARHPLGNLPDLIQIKMPCFQQFAL